MVEMASKYTAEIPEAILEQASVWHARMHDSDLQESQGCQLKAQFNTWLLADPLHRVAYDDMSSLWDVLTHSELSENDLILEPTVQKTFIKRVSRPFYAAVASVALFVAIAGVGWQQNWPLRLQSDYYSNVGEQKVVQLDDNSEIILNTNSAIKVNYTKQLREVVLLQGEARFNVAKNSERPFVVNTTQGTVTVTGTQFNVSLYSDSATVSLFEGSVALTSNQARKLRKNLSANQQAKLFSTGIGAVSEFDAAVVNAWQRGQLVFYSAALSEVVAKLNRYRKGKIIITDDSVNNLQISGVFSINDPDAALEMITETLALKQTRLTDYLVMLH
ncbi:FecR family protein [Pseudoalteromonas sp. SR44-5]|uniref:FecR family protein n=1 Tax=unclassified Pseudoalteromonas TaxID=194690 RepID=UPI0016038C8C|nr:MULTISPECIES: FecR family protein [unclassified Pseudoalteromonas]MBB1335610.1 FecR family protein [Pseudoalteromonas sp. SR41-6]MBB1342519.1 FecR family protein [Pseudoalteromonas sp. SR45-6]MBB1367743.1 FecR family protein [Pseudoalteromonas sp. SR44-5]MBB1419613.1 FecR family protein [Pseudoalteromonas sp. SG44-1]MBB1422980.1 FecR family protein [Pseudoalteromonas sp. SG43-7]